METKIKTDVLVVGAGPTGLSLACQLVRYGVDFGDAPGLNGGDMVSK